MPHNKSHKVVIVGVGSIGERHLRCFQATGRAEVSFIEVNPLLRSEISERYGVDGYEDLSAMGHVPTSAVVATPAHLHVSIATGLAAAGIHVLIEKPLSLCETGIPELAEVAHRRNCRLAVAYVYRCHPLLADMRESLLSGQFGRPVELVAVFGQHFPTFRPAYRQIYYARRSTGGGAIQDALTHVINAGEWLLGPVTRVVADAAHQVLADVEVEDTVHVLARHGKVLASYSLNQHQAANEATITVVCERGTLRWEVNELRWRFIAEPGGKWHDKNLPALERDSLFINQANRFLDSVEHNALPACTLEEGLQTMRVSLAIMDSVESGCWRTLLPEQKT